MNFEKSISKVEKIGRITGYIFVYFLFTTILFYMFVLLDRFPASWSYLHLVGITFLITLLGVEIKWELSVK